MRAYGSTIAATILSLAAVLNAVVASAGDLSPGVNLFFIKRSLNDNEVHYDAVVNTDDCTWQSPYVVSYWRDLQKGDHVYSKIKWWEHGAYGFKAARRDDKTIEIRLTPFESAGIDRPVTARLSSTETGCRITATINIKDSESEFQSAYIKVAGILKQSYAYFDLLGYRKGRKGSNVEPDRVSQRFPKDEGKVFPENPLPIYWQSGVVERGLSMGRPL